MLGKLHIPYYVTTELDKRLQREHWMTIVNGIHANMTEERTNGFLDRYPIKTRVWFSQTPDAFAIMVAYLNPYTCPDNISRYWKIDGQTNYI